MISSEQILKGATEDGSLDPKEWPGALEFILSRLDQIVAEWDPQPVAPTSTSIPETPAKASSSHPSSPKDSSSTLQGDEQPPSRPPVPPFSPSQSSQPASSKSRLPAELETQITFIKTSLPNTFPSKPPHTIQRLAELILDPRKHYKHLPPYLRAVDRVVNVSSNTTVFPLPTSNFANGVHGFSTDSKSNLGSDESLGGALLTPIPWLRDRAIAQASSNRDLKHESEEMIEGPNGAGRIETVTVVNGVLTTVTTLASNAPSQGSGSNATTTEEKLREEGAVTQGELLRQEQEAGVVPITHSNVPPLSGHPGPEIETAESHPHARGPDAIDAEDVGPQGRPMGGGLNIEAAVGRPARSPEPERPMASFEDVEMGDEGKEDGEEGMKEEKKAEDGFVLVHAGGKTAEGQKGDESGEKEMTDAAVEAAGQD